MQKPHLQYHNRIFDWSVAVFLFSLPLFAGKILSEQLCWNQGYYLNYMQFRITLHAILAFVVLIFAYIYNTQLRISRKKQLLLYFGAFLLLLYNLTTSMVGHSTIWALVSTYKLSELLFCSFALLFSFRYLILQQILIQKNIDNSAIPVSIFVSSLLQLIFVILQLLLARPVLPEIFYILGEPKSFVSFTYIGIGVFSRGYGTTPHPNILGGIMLLFINILLFRFLADKKNTTKLIMLLVPVVVLVVTFSRSALLALIVTFIIYIVLPRLMNNTALANRITAFTKKWWTSLLTVTLVNTVGIVALLVLGAVSPKLPYYFATRIQLIKSYATIIMYKPWNEILLGSGFISSIPQLIHHENNAPVSLIFNGAFLVEPPHNSIVLIINELGVLGTIGILSGASYVTQKLLFDDELLKTQKKEPPHLLAFEISLLISVSIFLLIDHYLLY